MSVATRVNGNGRANLHDGWCGALLIPISRVSYRYETVMSVFVQSGRGKDI